MGSTRLPPEKEGTRGARISTCQTTCPSTRHPRRRCRLCRPSHHQPGASSTKRPRRPFWVFARSFRRSGEVHPDSPFVPDTPLESRQLPTPMIVTSMSVPRYPTSLTQIQQQHRGSLWQPSQPCKIELRHMRWTIMCHQSSDEWFYSDSSRSSHHVPYA